MCGIALISRCSFDSVVLQVYPMRNYHFRHTGVLFPVALTPIAAFEAFSRVQSERSERLRELHEVQGSRELAPWRGSGASSPGRVWGAGVQWTPLSRRLRSADRAGRREESSSPSADGEILRTHHSAPVRKLCNPRSELKYRGTERRRTYQ